MSEGGNNPLSNMPPWAWVVVYLAGGSAIGVGGLELTSKSSEAPTTEECPDPAFALYQAQQEIDELKKSHESMVTSFQMITALLSECNTGG